MAEQQQSTMPLSDLVRERRAELGLSLRALADRCIDPQTGVQELKFGWIDKLERGMPVIPPQVPALRALAAGLSLPLQRIQDEAAAQFLGIERSAEWSADGSVRAVVARMNELSPAEREELAALAEFYAQRRLAERNKGK